MLQPKRVKYRKQHRAKIRGWNSRCNTVAFGEYGLQALDCAWVTERQIEAVRVAIVRAMRKGGKMWIRIFPDRPYTKKPLETRMGKGKGNVEGWYAAVKKGTVMFEVAGVPEEVALRALKMASDKLGVRTRVIRKEEKSK